MVEKLFFELSALINSTIHIPVITTKHKMALAGLTYWFVHGARKCLGFDDTASVTRNGLHWVLDLREGLDLTIFFSGYFQRKVVQSCLTRLTEGAVVLDIGANMGAFTLHMAKAVGDQGRVIAVEPSLYPYKRLCRNLEANPTLQRQVHVFQIFLTAIRHQRAPDALQSSWRLAGDRKGAHPVHLGVPQVTTGSLALTLDELAEQEKIERLDLIKIDVDGAEDEVLAGGERLLRRFHPTVVIEVAPYTLVERGLAPDAPLVRLKRIGYTFMSLDGRTLSESELAKLMRLLPGQSKDIIAYYPGVDLDCA